MDDLSKIRESRNFSLDLYIYRMLIWEVAHPKSRTREGCFEEKLLVPSGGGDLLVQMIGDNYKGVGEGNDNPYLGLNVNSLNMDNYSSCKR